MASDFHLSISESKRQLLKRMLNERSALGHGPTDKKIWRELGTRLQSDPMTFGEPDYELHHLKLRMRTAIVRPWVVHFAVDELRRIVYIKSFRTMDEHE